MRRVTRGIAIGLLIGGLAGLWFGMNIGKEQPLISNPFEEVSLSQDLDRAAEEAADKASSAVDEAGEAVQEAGEKVQGAAE
jgi:hypothetical protein